MYNGGIYVTVMFIFKVLAFMLGTNHKWEDLNIGNVSPFGFGGWKLEMELLPSEA